MNLATGQIIPLFFQNQYLTDVYGFLAGTHLFPNPHIVPYPSLYTVDGNGHRYLSGARSIIFTLGNNAHQPMYPQYISEVSQLAWELNRQPAGQPQLVTYPRPNAGHTIRITIEYSHYRRELRVMYKYTDGQEGYNIAYVSVPP